MANWLATGEEVSFFAIAGAETSMELVGREVLFLSFDWASCPAIGRYF
jgi:hypothetical protein